MTDGKPFEPTPSRLARARREGDLPRSLELPGGAALTGACLCVAVVTPHLGSAVVHALKSAVSGEPTPGPYITVAVCVMAVCFAAAACGVVACLVANGGIAVKALGVDFTKINPVAGLRRMFSVRAIGFGGRAMLAATIAGLALAPAVYRAFSQNAAAEPVVSAETVVRALQSVLVTACALGVAFGVLDALLERLLWRRRLRMSLFEMKEDLKQVKVIRTYGIVAAHSTVRLFVVHFRGCRRPPSSSPIRRTSRSHCSIVRRQYPSHAFSFAPSMPAHVS